MARRQERVNGLLRELVAEIIARELKDPRLDLELISVTEAHVSPDLQHARLRVSVMGSDLQRDAVVSALNHSRHFIERQLRPRLRLKHIPDLRFERDDHIEEDRRILDLLDRIQREGLPSVDTGSVADPAPSDASLDKPRQGPSPAEPDSG